jgi:hypothetical protein
MKRLEAAEERVKPKDTGDLQRRIEDFATRYQEGEDDELLAKYKEVFEKTEERPRQPAVEDDSDDFAGSKRDEGAEPLRSPVDSLQTPLKEFNYSEVKRGWSERVERLPDGSTIRHIHLDLTQVDADESDELDRPSWDWSPGPRPPTYRDVKRSMGIED